MGQVGTALELIGLGLATGVYGTLIGAGGGFVLMPLLLLLYPHESPAVLATISLIVVFFNALAGSESYAFMKRIDYRAGLLFALATIPGAIFGAMNTAQVPRHVFDLIFGVVLLGGAVFLFLDPGLGRKRGVEANPDGTADPADGGAPGADRGKGHGAGHGLTRHLTHRMTGPDGNVQTFSFNPYLGVGISLLVGFVSSFLGIGGGIIHVPALVMLLHFPVHIATATSHFMLAIMALAGSTVHILEGDLAHGLLRTLALGVGVVLGAPLGAQLSRRLRGRWIIRGLALALGAAGIRILVMFLEKG